MNHYNKGPRRSLSGLYDYFYYSKINTEEYVNKLWPREMVYVYAVNKGDTPQDLKLSYSGAKRELEDVQLLVVGTVIALLTLN